VTARRLVPGVYDSVVSEALAALLAALPAELRSFDEPLDPDVAPQALARLVHDRLLHTLKATTETDDSPRLARQIALTNALLEQMEALSSRKGITAHGDHVHATARRLFAVVPVTADLGDTAPPLRPEIPLSTSELLVNGRHDLRLGTEVVRELASADSVDLLCSFLKWSGFRVIEDALRAFLARRPGGLRVLTTAYMGATERRALDALADLGAQVKVSYDTERTRLHAKAWLFHRASGFTTACIGSSNLSHAAMLDGLEWNVRLSQIDNDPILAKFRTVFEQYWSDPTFESFDPVRDRDRWDAAVRQQAAGRSKLLLSIHVDPKPHQDEILERLEAERERGHHKNLVVAATGTGKTFIAAFDYKRLRKQLGGRARLLFVAHRHEILEQSMTVFRIVLGDPIFGERLGGGQRPDSGEHIFANVQSLHEARLAEVAPDAYDVVIVDEFHHAAAKTYDALLTRLRPKFLIGLTATPERGDGKSILGWFDGRIAAELRLWKALDQGLLAPFQYFGVSDGTELGHLKWASNGYDVASLRNVYTANDLWIRRVLQEVNRRVADPMRMRALGFCVDIAHAEYVALRFNEAGLGSVAVSQRTPEGERADALLRLQAGELRAVFSVDLFNEGVDVPDVDTILFLRPTESATIFLQQLGRGLRRRPEKECLTVLDFIGGAHRKFRFDARFRAIVGGTRQQIVGEIERGFPRLPSGCSIQLDRVAQEIVVENIKAAVGRGDDVLVEDLRAIGRDVDLAGFLGQAGLDLEDVYGRAGRSWTRLRRRAGLPSPAAIGEAGAETEAKLERALARLLHVDDGFRLEAFTALVAAEPTRRAVASDPAARMLFAALGWMNRPLTEIDAAFAELRAAPAIGEELRELFALLDDQRGRTWPLEGKLSALPLRFHATYGLDEVMAALDERDKKGGIRRLREGVFHAKSLRADLLFVTLDKAEGDYSPTTMYNDYPLSPRRFHWESQPNIHADTDTGRRYVEHERHGHAVLIFVRQKKTERPDVTAPYTCLGPVRYVRHERAKPMAIEWELEREMPAWLFQEIKVAAG
jgi:superfamily II DNA or RNA helicase/HKD family nuclease